MPKGRIETRGSVLLGAAVALVSAGLLRVDGVLISLGCAAAVLLVVCWLLGWMNVRGLKAELELPEVAQAGAVVRMRVVVRNRRRVVDALGLEMEIRACGGMETECLIPWVPVGSSADAEMRVSFPTRGRGDSIRCTMVSVFPLGIFRTVVDQEIRHSQVVLPRPLLTSELTAMGSAMEAESSRSSVIRETTGEPRGLREYRAGDSARAIVWPASLRSRARGGGMVVCEVDPPGFQPQQVVMVFHSYAELGALIRPDRFERAISLLWGAMKYFHARGIPVELLADFEEWVPRRVVNRRQLGQTGEMLASASRSAATEEHELLGRLQDLGPDGPVLVFSDMPTASWRARCGPRRSLVVVDAAFSGSGEREGGRRA